MENPNQPLRPWEALQGHDRDFLREHATRLQQTDGEGWAIGQEILNYLEAKVPTWGVPVTTS